ncbi:hypothetical protein [Flavobacterium filum]|uniref:hypothetical protein n=1 Tax=Flavobacterium filum TaxID=370974 RepID=UPI0023F271F9|nr:hypothetical protein [Flavobacterium filum]
MKNFANMSPLKSKFWKWLENDLIKYGKHPLSDVLASGAFIANCSTTSSRRYLGQILTHKTSNIQITIDTKTGIKFVELVKGYKYIGDMNEYQFTQKMNRHKKKNVKKK